MRKTRKLALMSVLAAIALGIFTLEAQLPSIVPVPGVKLGLANVVTLTAMMLLGRKEAGGVLAVRILLGAMFTNPSTLIYSAMGGVFAYLIMCLLIGAFPEEHAWVVSAIAAVAHNAGQLTACVLIVKTPGVFAYAPILVISGIITGLFTGFAAVYLVKALRKTSIF